MRGDTAVKMMRAMAWAGLLGLLLHVPDAASATIRQLVEVVDIHNVSVSPDGNLAAFRTEQASIERNTYRTVWYVQPVDGASPPRRLGEGGEMLPDGGGSSKLERAVWSPDSKWIFFRAVHDERIDIWRAAVDGSSTEQITHEAANVRAFSLSADGSTVLYSVGATRQAVIDAELSEYDRGIHIDRSVSLGDHLFRSGFHEGRLATQRFTRKFEFVPLLSNVPDRWRAMDLSTGVAREIGSDHRPSAPLAVSDLPTGLGEVTLVVEDGGSGRIAMLRTQSGQDGDTRRSPVVLAMLPERRSRRPVECTAEPCKGKLISGIVWRPGSDEIVFTVSERDSELQQSIFRWNVVSGNVTPVVRSRGQLAGGGRWWPEPCAASASVLICVAADSDVPPRLESVDLDSGNRTVLFAPNQLLAQDMKEFVDVRFITWSDAQGKRYNGYFYPSLAVDGTPPPLFIVYYRCTGFLRGSVGDEWPLATLARNGIAALCINTASNDNDAFVRYQQGLTAVESVIDLLARKGDIDPARVGMGGLSFGAEVAMWTAMRSDLLRATSQSSPAFSPNGSLMLSLGGKDHFARLERFWQLGTPEQTPERWRMLSPAYQIDQVRAPSLMQMPEQEYRYALDYLVPLIREHRADVYVFPNEPHQKFQPRHQLAVYQRNLDWFRFWLQDYEDADPAKREQYVRWREMRDARSKTP